MIFPSNYFLLSLLKLLDVGLQICQCWHCSIMLMDIHTWYRPRWGRCVTNHKFGYSAWILLIFEWWTIPRLGCNTLRWHWYWWWWCLGLVQCRCQWCWAWTTWVTSPRRKMRHNMDGAQPRSRFRHTVRRPGQIVFPNSDSVCPNSDKKYLTVLTLRFLLLFFAYYEKRDLISPFRFVDCPLLASRRDAEKRLLGVF